MRLKEIKPGMVIHCKDDEEKKALLEEAERLGYVWYSTKGKPTERRVHGIGCTIHFYDADMNSFSADYKHITHSCDTGDSVIEFSDLIIPDPELSAEEALLAYDQMCKEHYYCNDCPIYKIIGDECTHKMDGHITEIVDVIKKWKADREKKEPETEKDESEAEKKEPEIETVDIYQIVEVLPDGSRKCVHEEDIRPEVGSTLFSEENENILKRYCMEHDGEYIAVHEVVSRVKR